MLAVDQTLEGKDEKSVLAKTVTLELSPPQTEIMARALASGTIALLLRSLEEGGGNAKALADASNSANHPQEGQMSVIRYGIERSATFGQRE